MALWSRVRAATRDSWAYLSEQPGRLRLVGVAFAAGAVLGAPVGDAGFDYTWRDPTFCGDCHVHDYANEAYDRSVHAGVTTCHDCHKVPLMHYPIELWVLATDPPQTPEDVGPTHVPSVVCGACHLEGSEEELTGPMTEALREQVVKIDHSPLHAVHLAATSRAPGAYRGATHGVVERPHGEDAPHGLDEETTAIGCLDCHGSGGDLSSHRFTADRSNCLGCHGEIEQATGRIAALPCQECHLGGFLGRAGGSEAP